MRESSVLLPKLCGADVELANFVSGVTLPQGTGYWASRALLREMEGVEPKGAWGSGSDSSGWTSGQNGDANSTDWGRKWLRNGGCTYIDLQHLELCIPETLDAFDHVASLHAMYRLAGRACAGANARLPNGLKIHAVANNSDHQGNSYGSHLNALIARSTWQNIFGRMSLLGLLSSFHASSIVVCGLGKVGSENGAAPVDYQCSQRADFLERIQSLTTTEFRGILNTRNEPLCGFSLRPRDAASGMARLHIICYDHNLCHGSAVLKIGSVQLVLAMIEAGCLDSSLILDDPLQALHDWSHDPSLRAVSPLMTGEPITAVDWQRRLVEKVSHFVAQGRSAGIVPQAERILELWSDTLEKLACKQFDLLTGRLDWVLKRAILEQALAQHGLGWSSPAVKRLDQLYSDLDPRAGLYWAYERAGVVERLIPEEEVLRREFEPPENTRAWTRGALLGIARPEHLEAVDWDHIRFTFERRWGWPHKVDLSLANPLHFTRRETEAVFSRSQDLAAIADRLAADSFSESEGAGASSTDPHPQTTASAVRNPQETHGRESENARASQPKGTGNSSNQPV